MSEYTAAELALEDAGAGTRNGFDTSYLEENARTAAVKDITFGSLAGMVGKVVEYPFDTVKVRLQSQPSTGPLRYSGPLDCFRQSLHEGGVRSLYRGISAPMFGAAVETSSLFFSYRLAQKGMSRVLDQPIESNGKLPVSALVVCGGASGAFTSGLLTPIELVKCQMQVPSGGGSAAARTASLPNPLAIIAAIYRHQGIRGFWRGQLGTLIRETGGSAAWFGSYEGVCAAFRASSDQVLLWHQLLAGASAGMAYNFICYPADTVKSRMQTEEIGSSSSTQQRKDSFWRVARKLWAEQGMRGMYRGCGITVARAAPSSAVIFAVYEALLGWWK